MPIKEIPLVDICITGGTQHRPVDDDVVARYAALMKEQKRAKGKSDFPPVAIVSDGKNNYLHDGYHRFFSHKKNGWKYIEANIEQGTRRDAIFFSFRANIDNAFPRQPGTVKGIVEKMLADEEWGKMSALEIALYVACTERYVFKIQESLNSSPASEPKKKTSRAKTRTVKRGDSEYDQKVPEKKVLDATGEQVPEHLLEYFERANEIREPIRALNAMLKHVKDCKDRGDKFYTYIKIELLTQEIGNVKRIFRFGLPYAVCGYCGADPNNEDCRACGGFGIVNELTHKSTPEELK